MRALETQQLHFCLTSFALKEEMGVKSLDPTDFTERAMHLLNIVALPIRKCSPCPFDFHIYQIICPSFNTEPPRTFAIKEEHVERQEQPQMAFLSHCFKCSFVIHVCCSEGLKSKIRHADRHCIVHSVK